MEPKISKITQGNLLITSKTLVKLSKSEITRFLAAALTISVSCQFDDPFLVDYKFGHRPELFGHTKRATYEAVKTGKHPSYFTKTA